MPEMGGNSENLDYNMPAEHCCMMFYVLYGFFFDESLVLIRDFLTIRETT